MLQGAFFDFAKLEYISSAGLRVLLFAQKVMNKQGKMVICNVNETYLSKAFGYGHGFTIGQYIFNPIFMLILGFGSSTYVGNPTE